MLNSVKFRVLGYLMNVVRAYQVASPVVVGRIGVAHEQSAYASDLRDGLREATDEADVAAVGWGSRVSPMLAGNRSVKAQIDVQSSTSTSRGTSRVTRTRHCGRSEVKVA